MPQHPRPERQLRLMQTRSNSGSCAGRPIVPDRSAEDVDAIDIRAPRFVRACAGSAETA